MKKYIKPDILSIELRVNNNIANSLSNALNLDFIEETDVVMDWDNFMN